MKQMPSNLRRICDGQRSDLSPEQVAAYDKICQEYQNGTAVASPGNGNRAPPEPSHGDRLPSLAIRGWNFAAAMSRWALAGMPRRTLDEISARLAICQACEYLQNQRCTKCGCPCVERNQLVNKLALATEKCPDGRWS